MVDVVEIVVGSAVVVDVTTFRICSPADFTVLNTVEATVVTAVGAPKTLPECLRVCLRITSEDVNILMLVHESSAVHAELV